MAHLKKNTFLSVCLDRISLCSLCGLKLTEIILPLPPSVSTVADSALKQNKTNTQTKKTHYIAQLKNHV